jgi:hypothetical protein
MRVDTSVLVSSKVTTVSFLSKLTSASVTPSTSVRAFLIVMGQAAQVMPGTDRVTVFDTAHAEVLSVVRRDTTAAANSFVIGISSLVKPWGDVGEGERDHHQGGDDPKHDLIGALRLRSCTDAPGLAFGGRSEDPPVGEKEGNERRWASPSTRTANRFTVWINWRRVRTIR